MCGHGYGQGSMVTQGEIFGVNPSPFLMKIHVWGSYRALLVNVTHGLLRVIHQLNTPTEMEKVGGVVGLCIAQRGGGG